MPMDGFSSKYSPWKIAHEEFLLLENPPIVADTQEQRFAAKNTVLDSYYKLSFINSETAP